MQGLLDSLLSSAHNVLAFLRYVSCCKPSAEYVILVTDLMIADALSSIHRGVPFGSPENAVAMDFHEESSHIVRPVGSERYA